MISDRLGRIFGNIIPKKVVSLVPSWTEFIADLGLAEKLVGITDYCSRPHSIQHLPKVGGTKNPRIKDIIRLHPNLVIANQEENKSYDVNRLRGQGVPVFVTGSKSVKDCIEEMNWIEFLLTGDIKKTRNFSIRLEQYRKPHRFTFCYLVWKNPYMAAGRQTYINAIIEFAGGSNIVEGLRYPKITLEELEERAPDFIFFPDEPYDFKPAEIETVSRILPTSRIQRLDGKLASWYGFRIGKALDFFAAINLE